MASNFSKEIIEACKRRGLIPKTSTVHSFDGKISVEVDDFSIKFIGYHGPSLFSSLFDFRVIAFHKSSQIFVVAGPAVIHVYRYEIPLGESLSKQHIYFMKDIRPFICKTLSKRATQKPLEVFSLEFNSNVLTINHREGTSQLKIQYISSIKGEFVHAGEVVTVKK
jgi:hypothetical protein